MALLVATLLVAPLAAGDTPQSSSGGKMKPAIRKPAGEARPNQSRTLLLPRRPVRIIAIEGTDLLLLIGQGDGISSLPLPVGPVTVTAIDELDLLIIRAP
jgi:hypothetical protein